jgi:hemerythrin
MLWNKSLETGIKHIDEQHKELFRQAEILVDKTQANRIESTMTFLRGYVGKHFRDEEAFQKMIRYPKFEFHHSLHVDFAKTFRQLLKEFDEGTNKISVVLRINQVVNRWLREHIMRHDKEFAEYYIRRKAAQARRPAGLKAR